MRVLRYTLALIALALCGTSLESRGIGVEASAAQAAPDIRVQPTSLTFTPSPTRPIFVEIDWMEDGTHTHRPSQAVIDAIVAAFAREGYAISIDVSNAIGHTATLAVNGSVSGSADVQAIRAAHFNHAADSRYFYSIWGHSYSFNGSSTTSSGIADLPGSVHLVTLGSFSGQTGSFANQVGTFIHEFGHNIGQRHGGSDGANYKPNYVSVMNYHYQLNGIGPSLLSRRYANTSSGFNSFGYSHGLLPGLNENALNELTGIGLGRAVDWNCNGTLEASVAKDIQDANHCSAAGTLSTIADYDNWTALNGFIRLDEGPPAYRGDAPEVCITPEEDAPMAAAIAAMRAAGDMPSEAEFMAEATSIPAGRAASAQFFEVINDGDAALNVTSVTLDAPAPWVTWEPRSFAVAPGGSQRVDVFINYQTMPTGQHTRRLLVASDDPDESPYPNAVNLTMGVNTSPPGAFGKTTPVHASGEYGTTVLLAWTASAGATSYEVCVDAINDAACVTWTPVGALTSMVWSSLSPGVAYYWHVRAHNANGTTYANGAPTVFFNFTTGALPSMFYNGQFTAGLAGWQLFDVPTGSMGAADVGGVFHFFRTGSQAVIFQNSGIPLAGNLALEATFKLGNTDSVSKRISVLLHDADFSDLHVCTFWLPAGQPLATYSMLTHTTKAWANATISVYAASVNAAGNTAPYQIDDVAVLPASNPVTETRCLDPNAPSPPGGAASGNLVTNGDFEAGPVPWALYGQIQGAVTSGVLQFIKLDGTPSGVVLQSTGHAMAVGDIVTTSFQLGNSSAVRKRVTAVAHDADFSDLAACTFWLSPGQALGNYAMRFYTSKAWGNATISIYPATVGNEQWIRLDNVGLQRTPSGPLAGTFCIEPGGTMPDASTGR